MSDSVNHPAHYNMLPNGIECIDVIQHFDFVIGSAIRYLWRCRHKEKLLEDLEKAKWYIEYEIKKHKKIMGTATPSTKLHIDYHSTPDLEIYGDNQILFNEK